MTITKSIIFRAYLTLISEAFSLRKGSLASIFYLPLSIKWSLAAPCEAQYYTLLLFVDNLPQVGEHLIYFPCTTTHAADLLPDLDD